MVLYLVIYKSQENIVALIYQSCEEKRVQI